MTPGLVRRTHCLGEVGTTLTLTNFEKRVGLLFKGVLYLVLTSSL
jgi:hypothetical protein